jgi:carboxyl-terminal processing protease
VKLALCALALCACTKSEVVQSFPDSFVGVGLELTNGAPYPVVVRALDGGPADAAGVLPGDRVTAIDGESTAGKGLGEAVMRLRGAPDSQVWMTVERGAEKLVIVLKRKAMKKTSGDYRSGP